MNKKNLTFFLIFLFGAFSTAKASEKKFCGDDNIYPQYRWSSEANDEALFYTKDRMTNRLPNNQNYNRFIAHENNTKPLISSVLCGDLPKSTSIE